MTIADVATLIEKFGVGLTCVVVILYIFVSEYRRRKDINDKKEAQSLEIEKKQNDYLINTETQQQNMYKSIIELISKQNQMMTEKIINEVTSHTITPEENIKLSLIEDQINSCLKRVLDKCNASRVALVRFHNGGRDMNKLSFLKMSMTNEVIQPGLKPLLPEFQNMFRSFLHYWWTELADTGKCYIYDTEDILEKDATMHEFLSNRGITAAFGVPIRAYNNGMIGYIIIEFMDNSNIDIAQVEHCLNDKKIKIETLMNIKDGKEE